jgi:hypothetical protein
VHDAHAQGRPASGRAGTQAARLGYVRDDRRSVLDSLLVMICYLAALMSKRFTKKKSAATPNLDPATLAKQQLLERQRKRASRTLLKRRRRKSNQ